MTFREVGAMFRDRTEAGRRLATRLERFRSEDPVVLALPRGGVPVAVEVASALSAPLDVLVVRKLGIPWHPELGFGAIGEGGVVVLNRELMMSAGLETQDVDHVVRAELEEVRRRGAAYRGDRPAPEIEGRTVLLVDDGIATGFTVRAAVEILRRRGARRVIVAAPVAPPAAVDELEAVADEVVVLEAFEPFIAVGQFYEEFSQTTDDEVIRLLAAGAGLPSGAQADLQTSVAIEVGSLRLAGDLRLPPAPMGIVVFAHGSGSSRHSPRNRTVARSLQAAGLGTLLFDLLTPEEELDRTNVFDIDLLADRLVGTTRWLLDRREAAGLPLGYFGASTGAAAALCAAAELGDQISAVVSRGGRPDLAGNRLGHVRAPTLLIVGELDDVVLELNRAAQRQLRCENALEIVSGATHLFEEAGALHEVAVLARTWFVRRFAGRIGSTVGSTSR